MANKLLKELLSFFVLHFPRRLTRTELVKLVYLFEYFFFGLYKRTYSGVQFVRDYYGPYSAEVISGAIFIDEVMNPLGGVTYRHY